MNTLPLPDAPAQPFGHERWLELLADTAYVRHVMIDGERQYGIFACDGTPLAAAPTRALAIAVIRKYDMRAVDAH